MFRAPARRDTACLEHPIACPPACRHATQPPAWVQDIEAPEHAFTCPPTEEGLKVVAVLQCAVFGLESCMERSLPQAVFQASLVQVCLASNRAVRGLCHRFRQARNLRERQLFLKATA